MISGEQVGGCCQVSVHTNSSCCSVALEASHTQWKVPMLYKAVISSHYISPPPPINRMFVFCIFLTVHLQEFFLFVGLHYALMLAWVLLMRTNFCGSIDGVRRFNFTWSQCLQSSNIPWMTLHCRACSAPLLLALLLVELQNACKKSWTEKCLRANICYIFEKLGVQGFPCVNTIQLGPSPFNSYPQCKKSSLCHHFRRNSWKLGSQNLHSKPKYWMPSKFKQT